MVEDQRHLPAASKEHHYLLVLSQLFYTDFLHVSVRIEVTESIVSRQLRHHMDTALAPFLPLTKARDTRQREINAAIPDRPQLWPWL